MAVMCQFAVTEHAIGQKKHSVSRHAYNNKKSRDGQNLLRNKGFNKLKYMQSD